MIDPTKITNYHLTHPQLEEHLLFWVFAAGHNARATAKGIEKFLTEICDEDRNPFHDICKYAETYDWAYVAYALKESGLGCWRRKSKTIKQLATININLKFCTVDDLEKIYGIGPKTARCFILHTRKGVRLAGLDTHILKFLKENGVDVPKSTPTGKKYKVLEQEFLKLCDKAGKEPADYDLEIWNNYSK